LKGRGTQLTKGGLLVESGKVQEGEGEKHGSCQARARGGSMESWALTGMEWEDHLYGQE